MAKNFNASLADLPEYKEIRGALLDGGAPVSVAGCVDSEMVHLTAELAGRGRSVLFLTYNEVRAQELFEDARTFAFTEPLLYPARDLLFCDSDVQGSLITQKRMAILKKLLELPDSFTITTVDALLDRIESPAMLSGRAIRLKAGLGADMNELLRKLTELGYSRVSSVSLPGEFARRGGILDIYPLTEDNPIRVEFWDTDIDSIRSFDPETQRSIEQLSETVIYPASELGDRASSLLAYLPADCLTVLDEPERLLDRAEAVSREYQESMLRRLEKIREEGGDPGETITLFEPAELMKRLAASAPLILTGLDYRGKPFPAAHHFSVEARSLHSYAGNFELLSGDLKKWQREKYRIILLCASRSRAQRLASDLGEYEIPAFFAEEEEKELFPGQLLVTYGFVRRSFTYPKLKLAVIAESDLFSRAARKKRRYSSEHGQKLLNITELNVGDYVIHEDYGLGVYRGIESKIVDNVKKDYLKISYRDGGNLFSPVTQMNKIEKYASSDTDRPPVLNRLGGADWQKTKSRVKKAVAEIAQDLVALYSARQNSAGYIYGEDTLWQKEFEEAFPYEETEDQVKAIEAVKSDMESSKIMDRLICGDVGFGKTEIAIRAAFKAVQESKQVAYLVPTTILAQQHYKTFFERMKDYPIRVALLSRFRTPSQIARTVDELKKGAVDIVIGTHRLLSKDVNFKDLGLLIIDEEQRFGVSDKEKIKKLKETVDVMSLTATPIPRTLHMSMIGIRDMSVLEEPPLDRIPIQTYVSEYNDEIAREAIARELARGGQVYYVYNKVKDIEETTARIAALVPDAVVAYAHGQMKERELEQIMYDFVNGDIDVLVSTTIIETGLDIPNVNTIIIQDSDRYGLAQLYQLRGRVGRSNRTAYAFLFYRGGRLLKDVAEKRLQAIREYTELGSGIRISMKDLEIRGAGNLLGAEQHGHMEAVGYELYCKMLGTAVRELKGEAEAFSFDTSIDMPIDAGLPAEYIANENQKMDIYRRIAQIQGQNDFEDMQDELIDRFGDLPRSVDHLLKIALLRADAHSSYITEITASFRQIRIKLLPQAPLDPAGLIALAKEYRGAAKLQGGEEPALLLALREGEIVTADALLEKTRELVRSVEKTKRE